MCGRDRDQQENNNDSETNNDMKTTYILTDTFNQHTISTHRTVEAAVAAQRKHLRGVKARNGSGSYLTYSITSSDGSDIGEEVDAARFALDNR